MLNYYKDHTVPLGSAKKEKAPALIERGIFIEEVRAEYTDEYKKTVEKAQKRT